MIYKFSKNDSIYFYQSFGSYQDARNFIQGVDIYMIEEAPISKIPSNEVRNSDKFFLAFMMDRFIHLNRVSNITSLESQILLTEFSAIKQLSEVGAVPEVLYEISSLPVDVTTPIARVYTKSRQSDDLSAINSYMSIRS